MSLEKLVSLESKDLPKWYGSNDHYNQVPMNWREVSEEEFVASGFFTYGFSHSEYRQFHDRKFGWFSGRLFYISDRPEGVAMTQEYENGRYRVKFFCFANCIHSFVGVGRQEMEELSKKFPHLKGKGTWGRCCHNSVCTKCGDYRFIDSSD